MQFYSSGERNPPFSDLPPLINVQLRSPPINDIFETCLLHYDSALFIFVKVHGNHSGRV